MALLEVTPDAGRAPRPGLHKARPRERAVRPWQRTAATCGARSGELRCTRGEGHGGLHEQASPGKTEDLEADRIRESVFFG
jgi:hypothetical protein